MKYVLGLDQGRTKTAAAIADLEGNILAIGCAGGGHHYLTGMGHAVGQMKSAAGEALRQAGGKPEDIAAVGGGLAGADLPHDCLALKRGVEAAFSCPVTVVNDCIIALIDAVGVMFAMRSLLFTYEVCRRQKYLTAAEKAAEVLATWTYLWDVPFNKGTVLGDHGFQTTGWAGCDVIPAGSYVDTEFIEFVPDVMRIARYCKNPYLARLAKIVYLGMQHGTSTYKDMYGYKMAGVQCEGYMNSLWLSDSENPEFSGAVAKLKGDDNDTCNGLINGQNLATMHWFLDHYGTLDVDTAVRQIVQSGTEH